MFEDSIHRVNRVPIAFQATSAAVGGEVVESHRIDNVGRHDDEWGRAE
jgi:hypothetical protein